MSVRFDRLSVRDALVLLGGLTGAAVMRLAGPVLRRVDDAQAGLDDDQED